jgi:hypothetical protein
MFMWAKRLLREGAALIDGDLGQKVNQSILLSAYSVDMNLHEAWDLASVS